MMALAFKADQNNLMTDIIVSCEPRREVSERKQKGRTKQTKIDNDELYLYVKESMSVFGTCSSLGIMTFDRHLLPISYLPPLSLPILGGSLLFFALNK